MTALWNRRHSRADDDFIQKLNAGEYGMSLKQLHPDEQTPWKTPPKFQADIVLVAGLGGHHTETWQHEAEGSKTLWPRDLLPHHIPDVRVLSFNYNTTLKGSASRAGITDHAASLLRVLSDKKEDEVSKDPTPIVFVGHSLGGLVIKQALFQASKDDKYKWLWEASRGIMFFSTPHYGMDPTKWRSFVHRVLKLDAPRPWVKPTEWMLSEVWKSGDGLVKISENFEPLCQYLAFQSFTEDRPVQGMKEVFVDQSAGRLRSPTEHHQMLRGDHTGVCQFSKEDQDGDFMIVGCGIVSLINQTPKAIDRIGRHGKKALYSLCSDEFHLQPMSRKPTAGTCGWIQDKPAIQNFLNNIGMSEKRNFWILGPPACGKSYLARYIITELSLSGSQDVIYCFINKSVPSRNHVNAVLRSTMQQALRLEPEVISQFLPTEIEDTGPVQDSLWSSEKVRSAWPSILAQVATKRSIIGVIDGFDELEEDCRQVFFTCLERAKEESHNSPNLRWVFLSRQVKIPDTEQAPKEPSIDTYHVRPEDTGPDISKTIQAGLDGVWAIKGFVGMAKQKAIQDKITEKSRGNYLSATLIAEDIKRRRGIESEQDILTLLEDPKFPKDWQSTYTYVINNTSKSATIGAILKQALWWAAFQCEGLTAPEFNIAQAVGRALEKKDTAVGEITASELQPLLDDNIEMTLNLYCGHLVKFQGGRLELVHSSLREYLLMSQAGASSSLFHAAHARICITYLTISQFKDSGPLPNAERMNLWESKVRGRVKENRFARYAALHWAGHVREAGSSWPSSSRDTGRQQVLEDERRGYSVCWTEVWWYYKMWPGRNFPRRLTLEDIGILSGRPEEDAVRGVRNEPEKVERQHTDDDVSIPPPVSSRITETLPAGLSMVQEVSPPANTDYGSNEATTDELPNPTQPAEAEAHEASFPTTSEQHSPIITSAKTPEKDRTDDDQDGDILSLLSESDDIADNPSQTSHAKPQESDSSGQAAERASPSLPTGPDPPSPELKQPVQQVPIRNPTPTERHPPEPRTPDVDIPKASKSPVDAIASSSTTRTGDRTPPPTPAKEPTVAKTVTAPKQKGSWWSRVTQVSSLLAKEVLDFGS